MRVFTLRARRNEVSTSSSRGRRRKRDGGRTLLGGLLLLGLALALGADADEAGVGARDAEGAEGTKVLLLGRDGARLLEDGRALGDGERGGDVLDALRVLGRVGRVAGLDLAGLLGEDDEAGLVGLEALDVELERLLRLVAAAVVDGDADREGLLGADAGLLELGLGEAAARTELAVVADRRGTDSRAEELNRAGSGWTARSSRRRVERKRVRQVEVR